MTTLEVIKNKTAYKEILKDSFGGVMYNVANRDLYNKDLIADIMQLWNSMTAGEQESADGIVKGAINFISGKY